MTTYTDRSRILTNQRCSRERFLEYHVQGTGIRLSKMIISLTTGIAIHDGVTRLLKGEDVEQAVKETLEAYSSEVSKRELGIGEFEDQLFVFNEQKALIEAWIRVYEKWQLPRIMDEYEVLEVEKEILYPLVYNGNLVDVVDIILMSKPDAILRDKSTGQLVIYSLKTSSSWTETNEKQNKYDDQGISELIAIEYLYNQGNQTEHKWFTTNEKAGSVFPLGEPKCVLCGCDISQKDRKCVSIEVQAIKMDFLIKGQRQLLSNGDGTKSKLQNSFLVHPYMSDSGFIQDFSVKYTKAKGWRRVNIWEEMSIKDWVDVLFERFYEDVDGGFDSYSGDKRNGIIITPYPYMRDKDDIENWLDQVRFQESTIHDRLDDLLELCQVTGVDKLVGARELNREYRKVLNEYFPQNRNQCFQYGRFCSFVEHCWGSETTKSYMFEARVPHHETELIEIKGREN